MFISISLALLALAAGLFLLAKTNKEELGKTFKLGSYFIIICSFLVMGMTIIRSFTQMVLHRAHDHEREYYHPWHKRHHHFFNHEGGDARMNTWNEREENRMEHPGFESHDRLSMQDQEIEKNPDERLERMTKHLSEQMSLNAEQSHKLQEILKASMEKENEIRTQANGNKEEFRKLSKENWQTRTEAIKKILTPEQLKTFNEREESRSSRYHHYDPRQNKDS